LVVDQSETQGGLEGTVDLDNRPAQLSLKSQSLEIGRNEQKPREARGKRRRQAPDDYPFSSRRHGVENTVTGEWWPFRGEGYRNSLAAAIQSPVEIRTRARTAVAVSW
jgi:hypothetical protein